MFQERPITPAQRSNRKTGGVVLLLLAFQLSICARPAYRDMAQFEGQSHRPGPDEPSPRTSIPERMSITIRVVLEDGSPLASNPLILPYSEEDCHVSGLFRDGTVRLEVRTGSDLNTVERNPHGPGCRLWKVAFPGYQSASGYVRDGTIVKMYRLGDHEGSSVSITTLHAPEKARKAYERGEALLNKRQWNQAERHFRAAIALYPAYAPAWSELGVALEQQGRLPEATEAFRKASEADPKYIKPLVQRARVAGAQNHWTEEREAAKQAIDLHAVDFPAAYFTYAEASYHLGALEEANQNCRRAIELDPRAEIPQAHLLLGLLLAERGITQEAMEQFHAFLKLVPTGAEAEKAREQIRKWEQTAKTR